MCNCVVVTAFFKLPVALLNKPTSVHNQCTLSSGVDVNKGTLWIILEIKIPNYLHVCDVWKKCSGHAKIDLVCAFKRHTDDLVVLWLSDDDSMRIVLASFDISYRDGVREHGVGIVGLKLKRKLFTNFYNFCTSTTILIQHI